MHRQKPYSGEERQHRPKLRMRRDTGKVKEAGIGDSETQTDRIKSLSKVHKTEAAFDEDMEFKLNELKRVLCGLSKPTP